MATPGRPQHNQLIRPTSDRTREAIFSILGSEAMGGAHVLDLFAGTGAFGLEAVSRGAQAAILVDQAKFALDLIKKNVTLCGFEAQVRIVKRDLCRGLEFLRQSSLTQQHACFDIVFMDPPYGLGKAAFFLDELQKHQLIHAESIIVYEDRRSSQLPERIGKLELYDQRKYGEAGVWFYQPASL